MGLSVVQIKEGQPGFLGRELNAHRQCRNFNQMYVCTRTSGHDNKHAAHILMGVEDAVYKPGEKFETQKVDGVETQVDMGGQLKPGRKAQEVIQVATWE